MTALEPIAAHRPRRRDAAAAETAATAHMAPARPGWRVNVSETLLDANLPAWGHLPAIRFPGGEWSYDELARQVGGLAGDLTARGLRPGDRVALALPDAPSWVVAFLALVRVGAVAALVPNGAPRDRRAEAVQRARPSMLITNDPGLAPEVPAIQPPSPHYGHRADPGPAPTRGGDPAYMLLTSGTTGPSKWAMHRHADISTCLATYGRHVLRLRPGDVTYSSASTATSYGLGNSLYFPLGAGACAWIDGARPSPAQAAAACVDGGVTVMLGVPTFWARLARHVAEGRVHREPFAEVRLAVSAGEPLPVAVFDAVGDQLGLALVDGLGSSEATNLYLSNRPGRPIRGSVGYVVPGYELRVCDERDQPVEAGHVGHLLVRGGSLMSGYLGDRPASDAALVDGWLRTGDLVQRGADGAFRFVGRAGDRFKSGGFWVDPHAVATVLAAHPAVAELCVVGVPDRLGILRVVAVVVPVEGADVDLREDLLAFARSRVARHEVPWAVALVAELPTTPSGKIRRDAVRHVAEAALSDGAPVAV